jgi:hypothetical protein
MSTAHPSESRGRKASGLPPSGHDSGVAIGAAGLARRTAVLPRAGNLLVTASSSDPAASPDSFAQRAARLVTFLLRRTLDGTNARRSETQLLAWITEHQRTHRGAGASTHFASTELGIILRALAGPGIDWVTMDAGGPQQLCMVIARCMVLQPEQR